MFGLVLIWKGRARTAKFSNLINRMGTLCIELRQQVLYFSHMCLLLDTFVDHRVLVEIDLLKFSKFQHFTRNDTRKEKITKCSLRTSHSRRRVYPYLKKFYMQTRLLESLKEYLAFGRFIRTNDSIRRIQVLRIC